MRKLALVVVCFYCLQLGRFGVLLADETELLRYLAEAYAQNIESLTHFRCKYTLKVGRSNSEEEAIRGETFVIPESGKGLWAKHGRLEYIKITAADPKLTVTTSTTGQVFATGYLGSWDFLRCDDLGMFCGSTGGTIASKLDVPDYYGPSNTPLSLGVLGDNGVDQIRNLLTSKDHKAEIIAGDVQGRTGRIQVSIRFRSSSLETKMIEFDADAGFLVRRVVTDDPDEGYHSEFLVPDVQQLPGRRWFPKRSIRIGCNRKQKETSEIVTRIADVVEMTVDPPGGWFDDYSVTFEKGGQINLGRDAGNWMTLAETITVKPKDLPALWKRTLAANGGRDTRPVSPANRKFWLTVSLKALVLILISLLAWRWWSARATT